MASADTNGLKAHLEEINKLTDRLLQLETPTAEAHQLSEEIGREIDAVRRLGHGDEDVRVLSSEA